MKKKSLVSLICVMLFTISILYASENNENSNVMDIVVSKSLILVSETDARTALDLWVSKLFKKHGRNYEINQYFCTSVKEIDEIAAKGKIDILSVPPYEFIQLECKDKFEPAFCNCTNFSLFKKYVLLANKDGQIKDLKDLIGKQVSICNKNDGFLSQMWLKTLMLKENCSTKEVQTVRFIKKPYSSNLITPVFFKQSDAALVSLDRFNTACELNSQMREKLCIVRESIPLVYSATFIRKSVFEKDKNIFRVKSEQLHKYPEGKMLLSMFKTDSLLIFNMSDLQSTIDLYEEYIKFFPDGS